MRHAHDRAGVRTNACAWRTLRGVKGIAAKDTPENDDGPMTGRRGVAGCATYLPAAAALAKSPAR